MKGPWTQDSRYLYQPIANAGKGNQKSKTLKHLLRVAHLHGIRPWCPWITALTSYPLQIWASFRSCLIRKAPFPHAMKRTQYFGTSVIKSFYLHKPRALLTSTKYVGCLSPNHQHLPSIHHLNRLAATHDVKTQRVHLHEATEKSLHKIQNCHISTPKLPKLSKHPWPLNQIPDALERFCKPEIEILTGSNVNSECGTWFGSALISSSFRVTSGKRQLSSNAKPRGRPMSLGRGRVSSYDRSRMVKVYCQTQDKSGAVCI